MKADEIDVCEINPSFKGCEVRVKPLYDINDGGKQRGFGLNIKMAGAKRYTLNKFTPFVFECENEASIAADMINEWSSKLDTEAN